MGRRMKQKRNQTEGKIHKSRKDLRKEQRKLKKAKRNEFFQRKKNKFKKQVSEPTNHEAPVISIGDMPVSKVRYKRSVKKYSESEGNQKLQMDMKKQRIKQLKKANQQEDKVIRKLEKQLKLNKKKRKSIPKSFTVDGLDYLLEVCDKKNVEDSTIMDITLHDNGAQFEEDLALIRGTTQVHDTSKRQTNSIMNSSDDDYEEEEEYDREKDVDNFVFGKGKDSETETSEGDFEEVMNSDDTDNYELDIPVKKTSEVSLECDMDTENDMHLLEGNTITVTNRTSSSSKVLNIKDRDDITRNVTKKSILKRKKNDVSNIGGNKRCKVSFESVDSVCEEDTEDIVEGKEGGEVGEFWEDIYGRTRDKDGNVIQARTVKYVPPHAQGSFEDTDSKKQEQLKRLRRQLKGLLNRLAENNINSIALEIEKLYMAHSRNNMNESLTQLLFESLVAQVLTPERLVMEHAMLVAILHANVGTEVGAHVLQVFVKKFHEHHERKEEVENKQLDNITLILCHLYNFRPA